MTNKKPTNVLVWLNYKAGLRTKISMTMKNVKAAMVSAEKKTLSNWIDADDLCVPVRGFLVTFVKLNKKGKLTEIELTEQYKGGFHG